MEQVGDVRRMRVQYHGWQNPPVWACYYEPPGAPRCYCHARSLDQMWVELAKYFDGSPLRIEERFRPFLQ